MNAKDVTRLTGRCPQCCTYENADHTCIRCGLPPRDPRVKSEGCRPVEIGSGYRLSVTVLDDHRVRLAVYDADARLVAEYEGFGRSDRAGTNVLLGARRP